jgi:hypothetical protein
MAEGGGREESCHHEEGFVLPPPLSFWLSTKLIAAMVGIRFEGGCWRAEGGGFLFRNHQLKPELIHHRARPELCSYYNNTTGVSLIYTT